MRMLLFVFVTLGLAWVLGGILFPSTQGGGTGEPAAIITSADIPGTALPSYMNRAVRGQPCIGAERCLVAFMAPWCPYCKASLPAYRRMQSMTANNDRLGVYMVLSAVGRRWQDHEAIAEKAGGLVYLDPADSAWNQVRGRGLGVPAWVVYDGDGSIVEATSGAVRPDSRRRVEALFGRLGLADYVAP